MILITDHIHLPPENSLPVVGIPASRDILAKKRWRGIAADHAEFGFDLEHPLTNGDMVHRSESAVYRVEQLPEPVLEIPLDPDPAQAALLAWRIGNLHFPLEMAGSLLRVADDPALRRMFDREQIAFCTAMAVFQPVAPATPHSHSHG
jgi:urease accessory protein